MLAVAPTYADLAPPLSADPLVTEFAPVYDDLVTTMLRAEDPDPVVRHVLAVCAGYAYSDLDTVATMMTRLGLERCRVAVVRQVVDAMFVSSTAYVVQSADGRVVIVCYRGTEPTNVVSWLTDIDVDPDLIHYDLDQEAGDEDYAVHAGFYRNVRATRLEVVDLLARALAGRPILGEAAAQDRDDEDELSPVEALYVTGHSLGGAMAALLTLMIRARPDYAPLAAILRATYTYGQPMVGTPELAAACAEATFGGTTAPLQDSVFRFVYAADVVPQLPPRQSGRFAHFGQEYRCERRDQGRSSEGGATWKLRQATTQTSLLGLSIGGLALLTRQLVHLRGLSLDQSIVDHMPHHYIDALRPPGVRTEFGD